MAHETISDNNQKARKSHMCYWCNRAIEKGTVYNRYFAIDDGDPNVTKMHLECRDECNASYSLSETESMHSEEITIDWLREQHDERLRDAQKRTKKNEP